MTTDAETKAPAPDDAETAEPGTPAVAGAIDDSNELLKEIDRLVELTKHKIDRNDETPCPSCTILVHIQLNRCPHCESDIAAHNALMRESTRRLGEIRAELDGQNGKRVDRDKAAAAERPMGERIKRFFTGSAPDERTERNVIDTDATAPRILGEVSPGDQLKVLESDGPWFKVKTRQGKTGWVFSTLVKDK
jgi:hypothetical protein